MSSSPDHTPYSTPPRLIPPAPARRKLSFSSSSPSHSCHSSTSSSSFFSFNDIETPPFSPIPTKFSSHSPHLKRIPFSWEQVPGLPKNYHLQHFKINNSSISPTIHHLPLPPAHPITKNLQIQQDHTPFNPKKQHLHHPRNRFQIRGDHDHDPFLAAFLECSKDDDDDDDGNFWRANNSKVSRTLSDRFGFVRMYTSCKSTCAVSESIVYLPRSTPHYLVNGRRHHRH